MCSVAERKRRLMKLKGTAESFDERRFTHIVTSVAVPT